MKTQAEQPKRLSDGKVIIDHALDEMYEGKVLFPKKHTHARQMIEKHGLPPVK